jgi:hypothetical protein
VISSIEEGEEKYKTGATGILHGAFCRPRNLFVLLFASSSC